MFVLSTLSGNMSFMTSGKTNYHHGDLRAALIEQTTEMITETGLESITMRALSERIGVSRTAAYRHFPNKIELLNAVTEEGFIRFAAVLKESRNDTSLDIKQSFDQMGSVYIKFALENQAFYRLMFSENQISKENSHDLKIAGEAAFTELVECLVEAQQASLIKTENVKTQASLVWSTMHGISSLLIDQRLEFEEGELPQFLKYMKDKLLISLQN